MSWNRCSIHLFHHLFHLFHLFRGLKRDLSGLAVLRLHVDAYLFTVKAS